jgi:hypothetical protein
MPDLNLEQAKSPENPVQDVTQRMSPPELNKADSGLRKSEVGIVGVMPDQVPDEARPESSSANGKGWVLVNVEGQAAPEDSTPAETPAGPQEQATVGSTARAVTDSPEPLTPSSPSSGARLKKPSPSSGSSGLSPNASMSPAAKAIVIIDAVDAKKKKSKDSPDSPVKVRRWFSLSREESVGSFR